VGYRCQGEKEHRTDGVTQFRQRNGWFRTKRGSQLAVTNGVKMPITGSQPRLLANTGEMGGAARPMHRINDVEQTLQSAHAS
jgi:hypothetical protein